MPPLDVDAVADAVGLMVKAALAPVLARVADLERQVADAVHTKDLAVVRAELVTEILAEKIPGPAGPAGPAGTDGKDGVNGKDGAAGMTYRGVYVHGKTYDLGDVVTYEGSMWHAGDTTEKQPGTGGPWTLAVKAGRDGRDKRVAA